MPNPEKFEVDLDVNLKGDGAAKAADALDKAGKAGGEAGNKIAEGAAKGESEHRKLHAILELLPEQFGRLGQLVHYLFNPWLLALEGVILAYTQIRERQEQLFERTAQLMEEERARRERFAAALFEEEQQRLDRATEYALKQQAILRNIDLIAEAEKRDLAALQLQTQETNTLIAAREKLYLTILKEHDASQDELDDVQTAFERQKQKMEQDEKAKEIAIQRAAIAKDQAEMDSQSALANRTNDLISEQNERLSGAQNTIADANKRLPDLDKEAASTAAKVAGFGDPAAFINAVGGAQTTDPFARIKRARYLRAKGDADRASKSASDLHEARDNAEETRKEAERALKVLQDAHDEAMKRKGDLSSSIHNATNAANQTEAANQSHAQTQDQANTINASEARERRRKALLDKANAGDNDAAIQYEAATSYGKGFNDLFKGVTGQSFQGGNQLTQIIQKAFRDHNEDMLRQIGDLIAGTILNSASHTQEQINGLKTQLAAVEQLAQRLHAQSP